VNTDPIQALVGPELAPALDGDSCARKVREFLHGLRFSGEKGGETYTLRSTENGIAQTIRSAVIVLREFPL
jgi:hypothetical protein